MAVWRKQRQLRNFNIIFCANFIEILISRIVVVYSFPVSCSKPINNLLRAEISVVQVLTCIILQVIDWTYKTVILFCYIM